MADLPILSTRWLADHHGVITAAKLREHGLRRATRQRLVGAGVLRRVAKGVYVITTAPSTLEQRCAILSAAHPSGFVTGPTAGALAGLRRMPRASALHFSLHHGVHLTQVTGVRFRQTTVIWAVDRMTRDDGIVVASWPRLAFDLAADLRQLDHISVVQQLLQERKVTTAELVAIERRLGHPTRPGSGVFRRTLSSLDGAAPTDSHPEVVLADALRRRHVPVEQQAKVIRASSGRTSRIDLAVPAVRWGVELDIHPEHRSLEGARDDARRRRDMHLSAWQIETVTELDMADVETLADDLLALYLVRQRQVTSQSSVS